MSRGNGTTIGYFIEARFTGKCEPPRIGKTTITNEWKRLHFKESDKTGVPNALFCEYAKHNGLLAYDTAMAMIGWTSATLGFANCVEFRLTKQKLEYSYSVTEVGIGETISLFEAEREAKFTEPEKPEIKND